MNKTDEIKAALEQLLSDVEAMYRGKDDEDDHEEYFGRFWTARTSDEAGNLEDHEDVEVSWPNLAISMRHARKVLGS